MMLDDTRMEVIQCLKACVMSRKGGVPFHALNADYKELVGEDVPFAMFGHESLMSFLRSVPGILMNEREGNVSAIATENTQHLQKLISKQKHKEKKVFSNKYIPYKKPQPSYMKESTNNYNYDKKNLQSYKPYNKQQAYSYHPQHPKHEQCEEIKHHPYEKNYDKKWQQRADRENWKPEDHKDHGYLGGRRVLFQNRKLTIVKKIQGCESENKVEPNHRFHSTNSERFADYQVIGDALMLDLLGWGPSELCDKDLTIAEASLRVLQYGCADKVVIALGTIDILKGVDISDLISDMRSLIDIVLDMGAEVVVCTIPPMPSISGNLKAISTVVAFNNRLKRMQKVAVINLDKVFKRGVSIKFDLYERAPVHIRGCKWPLTLLNEKGHQVVSRELLEQLLKCC